MSDETKLTDTAAANPTPIPNVQVAGNLEAGTPKAWNALILAAEIAWLLLGTYCYLMGLNQESRIVYWVVYIWQFNILQAFPVGAGRIPYAGCCYEWSTLGYAAFIIWPAIVIAVVLFLLRWLDQQSGIQLLERLKKLLWK